GTALASPALRLARLLAAQAAPDELARLLKDLETEGATALSSVLATELDVQTGKLDSLAASLSKLAESADEGSEERRDRSLVAGLLYEVAGQAGRARDEYERARSADPSYEAATRARLACSPASDKAALVLELERSLEEPQAAALALLEAAA